MTGSVSVNHVDVFLPGGSGLPPAGEPLWSSDLCSRHRSASVDPLAQGVERLQFGTACTVLPTLRKDSPFLLWIL